MTPIAVVRAEALFLSDLQPSSAPDAKTVRVAVVRTVRRYGVRGCACEFAREYGEHPDDAAARMAWAIRVIAATFAARHRNTVVRTARAELAASA